MAKKRKKIREFIKNNYSRIFSEQIDLKELKRRKINFFVKRLHKKYGNPSWANLSHELIQFLVDSKQILNQEDLDSFIEKVPLLSEKAVIKDFSHYHDEILQSDDSEASELFQEIREKITSGRIDSIASLEKAKNKALKDVQEKIEDKISREEERLDKFRSRIDEDLTKSPKELSQKYIMRKKSQSFQENRPWWEIMNLKQNPFPTVYGLSEIDEEDYDKIIVMLPIFKKYSERVRKYPEDLLNKTILFYGEFGCGKTTLFDYLYPFFISSNVVPLRVMLNASQSVFQIRNIFFQKLYDSLCKSVVKWKEFEPRSFITGYSSSELIQLFKIHLNNTSFKGFVIFLDGLHKYDTEVKLALDFLKGLQNFMEETIREGIKVSLFIAGSKLWIKELRENSAYEGSIFQKEPFDPITPIDAFELIKKRLETFSKDGSNNFQKFISYKDIERLMNVIQRSYPREIPFRTFIQEFLNRINDDKEGLDLLSINYNLDPESLEPILKKLTANKTLYDKFISLKRELHDTKKTLDSIAEILSIIQEKEVVEEGTDIFEENIELFSILNQYKLIVRNKKDGVFIWGLSRDLRKFCLDIEHTFKFSLKYYINQILFMKEQKSLDYADHSKGILSGLDRIARGNPTKEKEIFKLKKNIQDPFLEVINFLNKGKSFPEVLKKSKLVFQLILNYLYDLSGEEKKINSQKELFYEFLYTWKDNEIFRRYVSQLKYCEKHFSLSKEDKTSFIAAFVQAVRALIAKIEKWIRYNGLIIIGTKKLTNDDKDIYNSVRAFYWQHMYKDCVSTLWNLFETKFREFFYNFLYLIYGNDWKKALPRGVQKDLTREAQRYKKKGLPLKYHKKNELYLSQRGHPKNIIEYNTLWNDIFKHVFKTMNKSYVTDFLENLLTIANPEKHNNMEKFFAAHKEKIRELILNGFKILKKINSSYFKLLNVQCIKWENRQNGKYHIFLSLNKFNDNHSPQKIEIREEEGKSITEHFRSIANNKTVFNLASTKEIQKLFFKDYRTVIGLLCAGIKEGKIHLQRVEGSEVQIKYNSSPKLESGEREST